MKAYYSAFRRCINLSFKYIDPYDWFCAPGSHMYNKLNCILFLKRINPNPSQPPLSVSPHTPEPISSSGSWSRAPSSPHDCRRWSWWEGNDRRRHAGIVRSERLSVSSDAQPQHPSLRQAGPDAGLHRLLLAAVLLHLRSAVAGAALQTQALQLPDGVPVPVPAVGGSASAALLLLLQRLRDGQRARTLRLLAALLLPRLPAVLHAQPHEPLLRAGEPRLHGSRRGKPELQLK